MSHTLKLGSVRGVPLGAHWSLFLIVGFLVVSLGPAFTRISGTDTAAVGYVTAAVVACAFMASVMAHELGHVIVALRNGVPVRRVTLWALGGAAEIEGRMPSPGAAARIAFAGPAMSLVCAAAFAAAAAAVWPLAPSSLPAIALMWLAIMNVVIAAFNLLPGAPLDGGHIVAAIGWKLTSSRQRGDLAAAYAGLGLAYLLVAWGLWRTMRGEFGLFTVLIGVFLLSQARAQISVSRLEIATADRTVADVMTPLAAATPGAVTLSGVEAMGARDSFVPVLGPAGDVTGVLAPRTVRRVRPVDGAHAQIASLAVPLAPQRVASSALMGDVLDDAYRAAADGTMLGVVDGAGTLVGVLDRSTLTRLAARRTPVPTPAPA